MTPRLSPLPRGEWDDDAVAALRRAYGSVMADRVVAGDAGGENALGTLLRHPALAGPFLRYNAMLLSPPAAVAPRLRELMVLRVAWRTRSTYEWVQHVPMARSCGVTDAEIEAIADAADTATWSPLEAALLAATDQLLEQHRIDDATWALLAEHLDERQLLEITFVVGTYSCVAMVFNSVGLELEPELEVIPAPPLPPFVQKRPL